MTNTPDQLDLEGLESAAKAATPGPWTNTPARSIGYKSPMPDFHVAHIHVGPRENYGNALATAVMGGPGATGSSAEEVDANAAFIAAWNPTTALSILSRLRASEAECETLKRLLRAANGAAMTEIDRAVIAEGSASVLASALSDLVALYEDDEGAADLPQIVAAKAALASTRTPSGEARPDAGEQSAEALHPIEGLDLEDDLTEVIADSLGPDWTPRDGAKAVISALMTMKSGAV